MKNSKQQYNLNKIKKLTKFEDVLREKLKDFEFKKRHNTASKIVDKVLDIHRKFKLKRDLIAGAKSQTKEDVEDVMSGFDDYLSIIERSEVE